MRSVVGVLPWAVVMVLGAAVIWFLLDRQMAAGQWLLALVLLAHGAVHLLFLVPAPVPSSRGSAHEWPFDLRKSWLVTRTGIDAMRVRWIAIALIAVTIGAFGLAALATIGLVVPGAWWGGLVVAGAVVSMALLVVAFDPQLLLGIGIDIALLVVVLGSLWSPAQRSPDRAGAGLSGGAWPPRSPRAGPRRSGSRARSGLARLP